MTTRSADELLDYSPGNAHNSSWLVTLHFDSLTPKLRVQENDCGLYEAIANAERYARALGFPESVKRFAEEIG